MKEKEVKDIYKSIQVYKYINLKKEKKKRVVVWMW